MPLRAAFDAITPIEIVLSILVTMAGIWVLFTVGARVYAGAVLQTPVADEAARRVAVGRGVTGDPGP